MADIIEGIIDGLEDFTEGRCKHFKDDDELEEYLMELPDPMPIEMGCRGRENSGL